MEAPGTAPQIFVLETDGTRRQLTHLKGGAHDPAWSPDGDQIAFAANSGIFVIVVDGSHVHQLAGTPDWDIGPDWSPDGARIVFESESGMWLVSVPGGKLTQL